MVTGVAREAAPLTNPAAGRHVVRRGIAAVGLVSIALIHLLDVPGKFGELRRDALCRAHYQDSASGRGDDPEPATCGWGLLRARSPRRRSSATPSSRIAVLAWFIDVGGQDASIRS